MKALGPGVRMLVDVSQKLDLLDSIRQAKVPAQFDLVWYEEPVNPEDDNACAEVAAVIRIPEFPRYGKALAKGRWRSTAAPDPADRLTAPA